MVDSRSSFGLKKVEAAKGEGLNIKSTNSAKWLKSFFQWPLKKVSPIWGAQIGLI